LIREPPYPPDKSFGSKYRCAEGAIDDDAVERAEAQVAQAHALLNGSEDRLAALEARVAANVAETDRIKRRVVERLKKAENEK
jgi:hypothetical protein